jgi:LPS-assembly protein
VLVTAIAAVAIGLGLCCAPAGAQVAQVAPAPMLHFPPRPAPPAATPRPPANTPMLVQADEMKYDYSNNTVSAVGHVQIYYGGSTVEAD